MLVSGEGSILLGQLGQHNLMHSLYSVLVYKSCDVNIRGIGKGGLHDIDAGMDGHREAPLYIRYMLGNA